jgi:hypothetical protein
MTRDAMKIQINCNQSFHRHIPYYGEILFFDENLFKKYFIR